MLVQHPKETSRWLRSIATLTGVLALVGCGSSDDAREKPLNLDFLARFGAEPFDCNATFTELGTSKVSARALDFRLFVHDLELIRAGGERVPFSLANDGVWQRDGVALLDFEDGTGSCETGSAETNQSVRGSAPPHDDYTGVAFTIGVPNDMNHLDAATAPAPLNTPGMWWSWQGGFRYLRVDVATDDNPDGFFFHLGGTNCTGTVAQGFACQYPNLARVELRSNALGAIVIDAEALYRDVDLSKKPDLRSDLVAGCMASAGDPECPAMFGALGLPFQGSQHEAPPQSVFELQ
jgi:uncharacterized repeat protein (TIGR04052 family)